MNPFLLGLRLLWGSGRRGRLRFLLMAFGSGLGVACLAAVLTIPTILSAHDTRTTARQPVPAERGAVAFQKFLDPYGSRPLRRVFLARTGPGSVPPPPGVAALPGPGEAVVSPALRNILTAHPGVSGLVPGRVTATIGSEGLGGPDELYAYVGTTPDKLTEPQALARFGGGRLHDEVIDPETLDILRFTLGCIVLLPLGIFLSVCARLSGESRARRLAALRLVGLSIKDTVRVNAGETVAAAGLGAVLGLVGYLGVNEIAARIGLPGLRWYPADGRPEWSTVAVCLVGCPALAWVVGLFSARRAALSPIAVRRTAERRPPRTWGALLLVPGLGVICGYCVMSVMGRDPSGGSASSTLVPGAVLLTGVGLVLGLPPVTAWLARRLAGVPRSLPLTLAMRRTEVDPGSSLRVVTGLVLLVFGASLTQGVLIELDQVSRRTAPVQEYQLPLSGLSAAQQRELARLPGVRAYLASYSSWSAPDAPYSTGLDVVVGTCEQVAAFAVSVRGCVDDRVVRLGDGNPPSEYDPKPGDRFPFALRDGRKSVVTVPEGSTEMLAYQPSVLQPHSVLVPPSMAPAGLAAGAGTLTLVSGADAGTVRAVLDGIGTVAPTVEVDAVGIVIDALAQLTVVRSLLVVGMVLGLVVGVAAFVVSVADRALERRGQVAALGLLGARGGTLRVVQVVQVVVPLGVGLGGAVVAGWLAESSYLITGGGAVHWDWAGLPLLVGSAVGVLVVAGVASVPMVRRHVDPEHIRRD
ncbi:FtsX-like permease family protein [Streptomyces sp. NRRL F-5727]|uniref:FtsX-like permease family protein n=1 Tax=Streptomyces sp. NRRL F-5727 TaxID=1463871 RepID=UPI0004C994B3|nr:FtsX-like permease family protein [Streptomyces sp. NRRL F-5727]